jgi:glycosyltransferase involved in cell wall biosynthesis
MSKGTIVEINSSDGGSTGNIMHMIADAARENGYTCYTSCPVRRKNNRKDDKYHLTFGSLIEKKIHIILGKLTGLTGYFSVFDTIVFLKRLNAIHPDIIHLHNIHGSYLCLPMLFRYIKKNNIAMVWTFHDCWAFTGRCPHFLISNCENWKIGCRECKYPHKDYPEAYFNQARKMWKLKKSWFTGIKNGIIVTPSSWLAQLVKESFLNEYPLRIINNGIDLSVFHPLHDSDELHSLKREYNIDEGKYIVLGVASIWNYKKGLDVFVELSDRLGPNYQVVLVGVDQKTKQQLSSSIIAIEQTENQEKLAGLYSAATVFVNPTREDNFPTVNIEALACGTPVITFNTGGSPECIDELCGYVVEKGDISGLIEKINCVCMNSAFSEMNCVNRARQFEQGNVYTKYMDIFAKLIFVSDVKTI